LRRTVNRAPETQAPTAAAPTSAVASPSLHEPADTGEPLAERPRPAVPADLAVDFSDEPEDTKPEPTLEQSPAARFAALMHRGRISAKRKRYAVADDAFKEALALKPRDVGAMLGRANVLIELQQYAEAERLVRAALAQQSKNQRAYLLLGDVLWVQGKDKQAKAAYARCVEIDPTGGPGKTAQRILESL
jgi:tetratricopeptide (TPR) repeat protein